MSEVNEDQKPADAWSPQPRRSFMSKAAAVVIGSVVGIVPAAAGLMTLLDPVRPGRKKEEGGLLVPVTTLDALPADQQDAGCDKAEALLGFSLKTSSGNWMADYHHLRFRASIA